MSSENNAKSILEKRKTLIEKRMEKNRGNSRNRLTVIGKNTPAQQYKRDEEKIIRLILYER